MMTLYMVNDPVIGEISFSTALEAIIYALEIGVNEITVCQWFVDYNSLVTLANIPMEEVRI